MLTILLCPRSLQGLCVLLQVCKDAFALADSNRLHQVFEQPKHQTCSAGAGTQLLACDPLIPLGAVSVADWPPERLALL